MKPIREYYRIQQLSLSRYVQSFPLWFRILCLVFLAAGFFLLYKIDIENSDYKTIGIITAIYILISFSLSVKKTQKLFLHNYKVPVRLILVQREILLSIPFSVLNWNAGGICLFSGLIIIAFLQPDKISVQKQLSGFKPRYFFLKQSFQWHSFYRQAGFYMHCLGILGISMGVIHDNSNLSLVAFLLVGIVLGVGSILPAEPEYFVKIYLNPKQLIRNKTSEIFCNLFVLQFPLALVLLFFGVNAGYIAYFFLSTIVFCWLTFAVKYSGYPDGILALFILFFVIWPATILCLVIHSWMLLGVLFIGMFTGYFLWENLRKIFYQPDK